jgi:hypothetical protein
LSHTLGLPQYLYPLLKVSPQVKYPEEAVGICDAVEAPKKFSPVDGVDEIKGWNRPYSDRRTFRYVVKQD